MAELRRRLESIGVLFTKALQFGLVGQAAVALDQSPGGVELGVLYRRRKPYTNNREAARCRCFHDFGARFPGRVGVVEHYPGRA
jgi:hypothetical protein